MGVWRYGGDSVGERCARTGDDSLVRPGGAAEHRRLRRYPAGRQNASWDG